MESRMTNKLVVRTITVAMVIFVQMIGAQDCVFKISQVDNEVFGVPWLPAVKQRIKVTIDADEAMLYLSHEARATNGVDSYYKIVLDGTMLGFGVGQDNSVMFLGEALVRRNTQAINFLTLGTDVEILIDAVISQTGLQRVEILNANEEEIIAWTNPNSADRIDIRYIGFRMWGGGTATFEACDTIPILRSEGADAIQSSTKSDNEAQLAVDGLELTNLADGSCTFTTDSFEPWWRVDLAEEYDIKLVILFNRLDADSDLLLGAQVLVGSCPVSNRADNTICDEAVTSDDLMDGIPILKSCAENTYGQYVYVIGAARTLTLCEVKVYGEIIPEENQPKLLFQEVGYTHSEAQSQLSVSVQRFGAYPTCSSADITVTDNGATYGTDYTLRDSEVFFGVNSDGFEDVILQFTDDLLAETPEGLTVNLDTSSVIGAWTGVRDSVDVTIQDDDTVTYRFSQDKYFVSETDGVAEIEVIRIGGITNPGDIALTMTLASALPVSDYDNTRIQLHFDPDVTSMTGEIGIVDDTKLESVKEFYLGIEVLTDYGEVDPAFNQATVIIADNDDEFYLERTTLEVVESESAVIEVKRRGAIELRSRVELLVNADSASSSTDYSSVNLIPLVFEPNIDTVTHSISIVDDNYGEADEQFTVALRTEAGEISDGEGMITVTIKDDDARYILESEFATVSELDRTVQGAVLRTGYTNTQTSAKISTSFISASNNDFTSLLWYPITFNPGDERKEFSIIIQDDTEAERLETFRVYIDDADGFIGSPSQTLVTIVDNDSTVSLNSVSYDVRETDNLFTVEVSRSGIEDNSASVRLLSSTGSATAEDYSSIDETISFPVGVSTISVPISVFQDNLEEEDETFTLLLTSAVNITLGDITQSTVTIVSSSTTDGPAIDITGTGISSAAVIGLSVPAGVVTLLVVIIAVAFICLRNNQKQRPGRVPSAFPTQVPQDPNAPFAGGMVTAFNNQYGSGYWGSPSQMYANSMGPNMNYGNGSGAADMRSEMQRQMMGLNMPSTYREFGDGIVYSNARLMNY